MIEYRFEINKIRQNIRDTSLRLNKCLEFGDYSRALTWCICLIANYQKLGVLLDKERKELRHA